MDPSHPEGPPSWVQAMLQHFTQQNERMLLQFTQQNERMQRLEEALIQRERSQPTPDESVPEVNEANEAAEIPIPPSPSPEAPRRPRPRLPDPEKFAGSVNDWPTWRITMENKLAVDGDAIGSPREQFMYIFSRLEKVAWKNTGTYVRTYRETGTPELLLTYLENMYGDPNACARAARRLHQMKQADDVPFSKFLPRLEREFADAGALDWPDEAKRQILIGALNRETSYALMSRGIPRTFLELISCLHEISNDRDALEISGTSWAAPSKRSTKKAKHVDEMDWAPTVKANRTETQRKEAKRARWVDEEEYQRRKDEDRCLRCGKRDCRVAKCPYLPAKQPVQVQKAKSSRKGKGDSSAEDTDEETFSDDSEKE